MRGQRRFLLRRFGAASAAVFVAGSLVGCQSTDDAGTRSADRSEKAAAASTSNGAEDSDAEDSDVTPVTASSTLERPDWLPAVLPVSQGAELISVGRRACTVSFHAVGSDAQLEGGNLSDRADGNGLQVELTSSTTEAEPVVEEAPEFGDLLEDEVPAAPVVTHVVVLRMQRAADAAEPAVDATLTLTSRGDGAVTGEYALPDDAC